MCQAIGTCVCANSAYVTSASTAPSISLLPPVRVSAVTVSGIVFSAAVIRSVLLAVATFRFEISSKRFGLSHWRFAISEKRFGFSHWRFEISGKRFEFSHFPFKNPVTTVPGSDRCFAISKKRFEISEKRFRFSHFRFEISRTAVRYSDFCFRISERRGEIITECLPFSPRFFWLRQSICGKAPLFRRRLNNPPAATPPIST